MVLIRTLATAALLAGCGQSLFDSHGKPDGGGTAIPSTCPETCLADAASDFDGTAGGMGNHWRYLDDRRDRSWVAMTASNSVFTGADPANQITSCRTNADAAACSALPGALLVSTAGATKPADPAIEYTATTAQVIKISIGVRVPEGEPAQEIRLYRNSREDVLYTGTAAPGVDLGQEVTVDALAGDRFLIAVVPHAMGATNVGLQAFVSATGQAFPATCQLAVPFSAAMGNTTMNLCGAPLTYNVYEPVNMPTPPTLAAGPFPEQGMAADILPDRYYESPGILDKMNDVTVQLWVRHDAFVSPYVAWAFSDLDLDATGGLGIDIYDQSGTPQLEVLNCTKATTTFEFAGDHSPFPMTGWHFVRVVQRGTMVEVCLDGSRVFSFPAAKGALGSTHHPYLGKNVLWTPSGAFWDGGIDDVRVFTGALPCD